MGMLSGIKIVVVAVAMGFSMVSVADDYEAGLVAWSEGDHGRAVQYFLRAAEQGSIGAKQMLVTMFERGQGVALDQEQYFQWVAHAAGSGIPAARFELARLLEQRADPKDPQPMLVQALVWYQKAANSGYYPAWLELARFHEQGLAGLQQDKKEAARFYGMAASEYLVFSQKGEPMAQNQLGELYEQGKGVKKNMGEAIYWYRKAAGQQLAKAEFNLGRVYAEGIGVNRNEMLALRMMRDAVAHGSGEAKVVLERMEATGQAGVASAR